MTSTVTATAGRVETKTPPSETDRPVSGGTGSSQKELKQRLKAVFNACPQNQVCCDCGDKKPTWASLIVLPEIDGEPTPTLGVFCCYHCSGAHRRLGVHICFVRSITLDDWKEKEVAAMEIGGNERVNRAFEARYQEGASEPHKPHVRSDLNERDAFVRAKFSDRAFFDEYQYRRVISELRHRQDRQRAETNNNANSNNRNNEQQARSPQPRQRQRRRSSLPTVSNNDYADLFANTDGMDLFSDSKRHLFDDMESDPLAPADGADAVAATVSDNTQTFGSVSNSTAAFEAAQFVVEDDSHQQEQQQQTRPPRQQSKRRSSMQHRNSMDARRLDTAHVNEVSKQQGRLDRPSSTRDHVSSSSLTTSRQRPTMSRSRSFSSSRSKQGQQSLSTTDSRQRQSRPSDISAVAGTKRPSRNQSSSSANTDSRRESTVHVAPDKAQLRRSSIVGSSSSSNSNVQSRDRSVSRDRNTRNSDSVNSRHSTRRRRSMGHDTTTYSRSPVPHSSGHSVEGRRSPGPSGARKLSQRDLTDADDDCRSTRSSVSHRRTRPSTRGATGNSDRDGMSRRSSRRNLPTQEQQPSSRPRSHSARRRRRINSNVKHGSSDDSSTAITGGTNHSSSEGENTAVVSDDEMPLQNGYDRQESNSEGTHEDYELDDHMPVSMKILSKSSSQRRLEVEDRNTRQRSSRPPSRSSSFDDSDAESSRKLSSRSGSRRAHGTSSRRPPSRCNSDEFDDSSSRVSSTSHGRRQRRSQSRDKDDTDHNDNYYDDDDAASRYSRASTVRPARSSTDRSRSRSRRRATRRQHATSARMVAEANSESYQRSVSRERALDGAPRSSSSRRLKDRSKSREGDPLVSRRDSRRNSGGGLSSGSGHSKKSMPRVRSFGDVDDLDKRVTDHDNDERSRVERARMRRSQRCGASDTLLHVSSDHTDMPRRRSDGTRSSKSSLPVQSAHATGRCQTASLSSTKTAGLRPLTSTRLARRHASGETIDRGTTNSSNATFARK